MQILKFRLRSDPTTTDLLFLWPCVAKVLILNMEGQTPTLEAAACCSCLTKAFYSCHSKISHMLSLKTQGMTVGVSKDWGFVFFKKKNKQLLLSIQAEYYYSLLLIC